MSDPTDPGGLSGPHERPSRSTRVADSGSQVGSPLTIVLAVIAVAAGFLIFRSISDEGNAGGLSNDSDGTTTLPVIQPGETAAPVASPGSTEAGAEPTTAAAAAADTDRVTDGATVVVANASSTGQVAGPMSDQLAELGYTMGEPTSQQEGPDNLEESIVYFSVGNNCEPVARSVANDMGGLEVEAMPTPIPVEGGAIEGCVLLMLGNDYAGQDVPGPPPAAPAAPTNPATTED